MPQALFALHELSLLGSFGSRPHDLDAVLRLDDVADGLEMPRTRPGAPQRIVVEIAAG